MPDPVYVGGCKPFILSHRYCQEPWIPPFIVDGTGNDVYWEVQIGNISELFGYFDGYNGLVNINKSFTTYDDGVAPVSAGIGGFGYRGDGSVWVGGSGGSSGSVLIGLTQYGANDRLMFAVKIDTGEAWIGVNGVWLSGLNPETDPELVNIGDPDAECFDGARAPYLHPRHPGDQVRLHTVEGEFVYPIPVGFRPLTVDQPETPQIYEWAAIQPGFAEFDDFRGVENVSSEVQNFYPLRAPIDTDLLLAPAAEMTAYNLDAWLGGIGAGGFHVLTTELFSSQTNWGAFVASTLEVWIEFIPSYTPPTPGDNDLIFEGAYTPPAGNNANLVFG